MKTLNPLTRLLVIASVVVATINPALASPPAKATGGESSGGGTAIYLPDDSIVLARSPYVLRRGSVTNLHPDLREELQSIDLLLRRYGLERTFFDRAVFNPLVEYVFVSQEEMDEIVREHSCQ